MDDILPHIPDGTLTTTEAAKRLGMYTASVRRLRALGVLVSAGRYRPPGRRGSGEWLLTAESVAAYVDRPHGPGRPRAAQVPAEAGL